MTNRALYDAVLTIAGSADETPLIAAGGAGVFHDIQAITLGNTSNSDVVVTIRDANGAPEHRWKWPIKAGAAFGFNRDWDSAARQRAANGAWTIQCEPAIESLEVTVEYHRRTNP